jgi:hypothetical protein
MTKPNVLMTKQEMKIKYPGWDEDLYGDVKEGIPSYNGSNGYSVFAGERMERQLLHEVGHACELFGSIDNDPNYYQLLEIVDEGQTTGSNFQENIADTIRDYLLNKEMDHDAKEIIKKWGIVG